MMWVPMAAALLVYYWNYPSIAPAISLVALTPSAYLALFRIRHRFVPFAGLQAAHFGYHFPRVAH
jgi:hypothetical protein